MKAKMLVVFALLALGFSTASAQMPKGVYPTMSACEAGTDNYTPSFLSGHRPAGPGEFEASLAQRQCGYLKVAGGHMAIVGQDTRTCMIWRGSQSDPANAVVDRRCDCGNSARDFRFIPAGPVAPPPTGVVRKSDPEQVPPAVVVNVAAIFAANKSEPPPSQPFWCVRGFGQGFTCLAGIAAVAYGGYKLFHRDDKPAAETPKKGPGVTSDSSKVTCTGFPCPGAPPTVSPQPTGRNGLVIDPAQRLVGWRFAFPRR